VTRIMYQDCQPVANVCRGGPKIIVTPLASSINFRSWKLKLQRTVGPLLVYSCWAWPCPQSNASVLERLPSYVRRKDRCSEVLDPIQSSHVWLGCGRVLITATRHRPLEFHSSANPDSSPLKYAKTSCTSWTVQKLMCEHSNTQWMQD